MAEPEYGAAGSPIEVVPVVVLSQVFTARPSSIPDIRDFVRRCLAESPLTAEGTREVSETVFRALLDAAGPTGSIQVAFRIFPEHVEVDVLHSDNVIQPPTVPGPPTAVVQPVQVVAPPGAGQPGQGQPGQGQGQAGYGQPVRGGQPGQPGRLIHAVRDAPDVRAVTERPPDAATGTGTGPASAGAADAGAAGTGLASADPAAAAGSTADSGDPGSETFAAWMSSALRREGMTQEAAARQLGVSVKTVSRWVGGATEPRMRDLRRIQEVFGEVPLP